MPVAIDSGHREKATLASGPKWQIDVLPPSHAAFLPVDEVAEALAKIDDVGRDRPRCEDLDDSQTPKRQGHGGPCCAAVGRFDARTVSRA